MPNLVCNHTTQLPHVLTQHTQPPLCTLLHFTQLTPACNELHNHKQATMRKPHQCRALQAALSIVEGMKAVGGQGCIGVTTGQLLCACVGSRIRAEYTVFGDSINLSARLMCKATAGMGDILCDYSTQHMATAAAAYTRLEPLVVRLRLSLMFDMTCGMQGFLVAHFKSCCCQAHPLCLSHLLQWDCFLNERQAVPSRSLGTKGCVACKRQAVGSGCALTEGSGAGERQAVPSGRVQCGAPAQQ